MNVLWNGDSGSLTTAAPDIPRYVNGHIRFLRHGAFTLISPAGARRLQTWPSRKLWGRSVGNNGQLFSPAARDDLSPELSSLSPRWEKGKLGQSPLELTHPAS